MQNRFFLISMLIVVMSASAFAQKEPPPFKKMVYIEKGDSLPYGLLQPGKPVQGEKYPLVIFLHGAGERGSDNEKNIKHIQLLFTANNHNKYPCYVVAPQCPKKEVWSDLMWGKPFSATPTRPMEMFLQLLEKIQKEYPIDLNRIYITGVSMGGFGTWDLMARFPNRFAAAVPICGGGDERTVEKIKHIPVWAFHGAKDETVPPKLSRKMIAALQNAGASPGYTEYPNVEHNSWYQAYKDPYLITWLFRQNLVAAKKPK
jgi:predicted peptidase